MRALFSREHKRARGGNNIAIKAIQMFLTLNGAKHIFDIYISRSYFKPKMKIEFDAKTKILNWPLIKKKLRQADSLHSKKKFYLLLTIAIYFL